MIKKTCALILDNEKVLIIKDKFIKEWRFFSTSKEEDKRYSRRTNIKILKVFKYKIKDEGFSIYVKENNLLIEGRIFRLNVDPIKFKVSKCIDSI